MALDLTGNDLAALITKALNIPTPPVNPTAAQTQAYNDAVKAQKDTWTTICNQILTYLHLNTELDIPALGISDGYGQACTGTSTTGTLK